MGLYLLARWLMDEGFFTIEEIPFALIGMAIILLINVITFLVMKKKKPMTAGFFQHYCLQSLLALDNSHKRKTSEALYS